MSKLFVLGTPIGNLGDITFRGVEVLKTADFIACEDTRITIKLLNHFEIKKPLVSYHQHSKESKIEQIISEIKSGKTVALVTDAGTPGVSDPGEKLIEAALKAKIEVEAVPGPSAAITALSISGLPTSEFTFIGFLPQKKGRQKKLSEILAEKRTLILYESPYRIKKLLTELLAFEADRNIFIVRELTKKFEEQYRGKVSEVLPKIKEKGEFTVILEGKND